MLNIFNVFFGKTPVVGEIYTFRDWGKAKGNPFNKEQKKEHQIEVLEVKEGWVKHKFLTTTDMYQIGGLRRGQFVCILGGYKGCKSWFCHHLAKQALIQGRNVLHNEALDEKTFRFCYKLKKQL